VGIGCSAAMMIDDHLAWQHQQRTQQSGLQWGAGRHESTARVVGVYNLTIKPGWEREGVI